MASNVFSLGSVAARLVAFCAALGSMSIGQRYTRLVAQRDGYQRECATFAGKAVVEPTIPRTIGSDEQNIRRRR